MILHVNRSEREALRRALEFRLQKLRARDRNDRLKAHDEADLVLLAPIYDQLLADRELVDR